MNYDLVIAILGSGLLSTIVSNLFAARKEKNNKSASIEKGVRVILYDRIKFLCKNYISKGEISINDWEDLKSLHKVYHDDLGGNGFLDTLMRQVGSLKMTTDN